MRRSNITAVVVLVLAAFACLPPGPVTVEPGDPVRIETSRSEDRVEGTTLEASTDGLVVRTTENDTTAFAAPEIERLEVNHPGARDAERVIGADLFSASGLASLFLGIICLTDSPEYDSATGCLYGAGAIALTIHGGRLMTRSDWVPGLLPGSPGTRGPGATAPDPEESP